MCISSFFFPCLLFTSPDDFIEDDFSLRKIASARAMTNPAPPRTQPRNDNSSSNEARFSRNPLCRKMIDVAHTFSPMVACCNRAPPLSAALCVSHYLHIYICRSGSSALLSIVDESERDDTVGVGGLQEYTDKRGKTIDRKTSHCCSISPALMYAVSGATRRTS